MIFLQIFICLAALYVFLMHPRIRRADSSPFLGTFFAHRGLHDNNHQIPENSLAAFQRAVDAGYGIELDVQLSADQIPVVFHDATLGRMCGIDRRVNELTFAELRQLSLVNTKEHIPSFQEALALVNGKVPLLVELKMEHLDFDIPREADALLSEYSGDYCIESFHPAALDWYRKNRPQRSKQRQKKRAVTISSPLCRRAMIRWRAMREATSPAEKGSVSPLQGQS